MGALVLGVLLFYCFQWAGVVVDTVYFCWNSVVLRLCSYRNRTYQLG